MIVVPTVRTPKTEAEAATALVSAFSSVIGRPPSRQVCELLLAQVWLETAHGASINNNNPGNLSAGTKYAGKVWLPPWVAEPGPNASARIIFLHKEMLANRAPRAFRAYDSFAEGMTDHFRALKNIFPSILSAAESGDPRVFASAIFTSKYCPDAACHPDKTTPTFRALQKVFQDKGTFKNLPLESIPPPPSPAKPCPGDS